MKKLFISILMGLTGSAMSLFAVPAKPTPFNFTQPDGSIIMLRLTGDEFNHMLLTTEGYPVARDEAGFYCFANIDANGEVKPTAVRAELVSKLNSADRLKVDEINPVLVRQALSARQSPRANKVASRAGSHTGIGLTDEAFLGRKELKGLVILAQFPDKKFDSKYGNAFFTEMLNKEGFDQYNATGSARDYFVDSSNGAFIPEFDVYGPVTLPNLMVYYGANDAYGNDVRPAEMIRDACKGLDDQINFKDYDLDGDGYVDNVFVFYAGFGEASYGSEETIWPHQWELSAARISLTLDGVKINKYACSNELERDSRNSIVPCGIGTFVHEFSHVLGLPDLYATGDDAGYWTPGFWSVMDHGSYNNDSRTPPSYSAYERNALGWCDPMEIYGPASITLEAISISNKACLIPTYKTNEFFLLENRQQTGWDKYLPGHGMLIWHIDYNKNVWYQNTVNNRKSHNYVDLVEACGRTVDDMDECFDLYGNLNYDKYLAALARYAFPGPDGVTSITDDTDPSMKMWSGNGIGLPLTNISEVNGLIKFDVDGGRCDADIPVVVAPAEVGPNWFTATWNAAAGASYYRLTVENTVTSGFDISETADFGNGDISVLPEGWEYIGMTEEDIFKTSGNYGEGAPALRFGEANCGIMTREYESDIKGVSFWTKGQATDKVSYIAVEGMKGDDWILIDKVYPASYKVVTAELTEIPAGVRKIRLIYNMSKGRVAVDDVVVTVDGGGTMVLEGYNELNVGNVTSYKVTDIPANAGVISYKVCAVDEFGSSSDYSESQIVTLSNSGIDAVTVGADATFRVDGDRVIYQGAAGARLMLLDFGGRTVATAVAGNDGVGELKAPSTGVYILVAPSLSAKVVVR